MQLDKEDFYRLATIRKLKEARILLDLTKKYLVSNFEYSEIMFSSFISSIWSVTQYLQKELKNLDECNITNKAYEWYKDIIEVTKNNEVCRLFWALRTASIHVHIIEPRLIIDIVDNKKIKIEGFFINYFEGNLRKFQNYDSKNLIPLAEEHFLIIESIVMEASDKFGFNDLPKQPFFTRPGYLKLEAKIKVTNYTLKNLNTSN